MTKFFLNLVDEKGNILDQALLFEKEEVKVKVNTDEGRIYFI